jgi:hypothetical protein
MKYEEFVTETGVERIKRIADDGLESFIPKDEANSDYQRYFRWLENPDAEEGGTL